MQRKLYQDGIRALGFLGIFTVHNDMRLWALWGCIPLFFAYSGYLITGLLLDASGASRPKMIAYFYGRRALRLMPVYFLTLAALLVLGELYFGGWHATYLFNWRIFYLTATVPTPPHLIPELSILQAHWRDAGTHFWTLCVEEQFYLLWPWFILYCPPRWRLGATTAMLAASTAIRMTLESTMPWSLYGATLPVAGDAILWGCLAQQVKRRYDLTPWRRLLLPVGLLFFVVFFLVEPPAPLTEFSGLQHIPGRMLFGFLLAVLMLGIELNDESRWIRWLEWKPLVYLGTISYGLYVVHLFTWRLFAWVTEAAPTLALIPPYVGRLTLTIALAALSWHLVERPLNGLKRRLPLRSNA